MISLDARDIANDLRRDLGDAAGETARARASDLRTHGDEHGAALWREVVRELDRQTSGSTPAGAEL